MPWRRHRFLCRRRDPRELTSGCASSKTHYSDLNHLHYITANTYRRAHILHSDRFKMKFVETLASLREELGFRMIGYVLMPEHCHLLIWPSDLANPSQVVPKLSKPALLCPGPKMSHHGAAPASSTGFMTYA